MRKSIDITKVSIGDIIGFDPYYNDGIKPAKARVTGLSPSTQQISIVLLEGYGHYFDKNKTFDGITSEHCVKINTICFTVSDGEI